MKNDKNNAFKTCWWPSYDAWKNISSYERIYRIDKRKNRTKPLYEIFREDYGEIIKVADEEFSAGIISDKEAKLLEVPGDSPCLKLLRTTYNDDNIVIEFTLSVARSDKFVYRVRHVR